MPKWVSLFLTDTGSIGWKLEARSTLAAVTARAVDAVRIPLAEIIAIAALVNIWKDNSSIQKSFISAFSITCT